MTALVRWVIGRPLDGMVVLIALLITTVLVGIQWSGTVHVTRRINRLSATLPVARRPIRSRTIVAGTVVVALLLLLVAFTGLLVAGDEITAATLLGGGAIMLLPALAGTGLLALFGRRTLAVLDRPEVVRMLVADKAVADAHRLHSQDGPDDRDERAGPAGAPTDLPTDRRMDR